jgi:heat shock protein HtpX
MLEMANLLKAVLVLAGLTAFMIFCGHVLGGQRGMTAAAVFVCLMDLGLYGFSGRIVLAMHRAQPLADEEAPEVFEIVRNLSGKAGIPAPRIYMLPSASANAFAAGRGPGHAVIAVTHGIVGLLNREELSGVLGHELSHVRSRDILPASIVAVLAGALCLMVSLCRWSFFWGGERDERDRDNPLPFLLSAVVMPVAAALVRLAVSRARAYAADQQGAGLCGDPLYLASALRKIDIASQRFPLRDPVPATAHLFITDPLSGKGWAALFRMHPSVEDRIARLEISPLLDKSTKW